MNEDKDHLIIKEKVFKMEDFMVGLEEVGNDINLAIDTMIILNKINARTNTPLSKIESKAIARNLDYLSVYAPNKAYQGVPGLESIGTFIAGVEDMTLDPKAIKDKVVEYIKMVVKFLQEQYKKLKKFLFDIYEYCTLSSQRAIKRMDKLSDDINKDMNAYNIKEGEETFINKNIERAFGINGFDVTPNGIIILIGGIHQLATDLIQVLEDFKIAFEKLVFHGLPPFIDEIKRSKDGQNPDTGEPGAFLEHGMHKKYESNIREVINDTTALFMMSLLKNFDDNGRDAEYPMTLDLPEVNQGLPSIRVVKHSKFPVPSIVLGKAVYLPYNYSFDISIGTNAVLPIIVSGLTDNSVSMNNKITVTPIKLKLTDIIVSCSNTLTVIKQAQITYKNDKLIEDTIKQLSNAQQFDMDDIKRNSEAIHKDLMELQRLMQNIIQSYVKMGTMVIEPTIRSVNAALEYIEECKKRYSGGRDLTPEELYTYAPKP